MEEGLSGQRLARGLLAKPTTRQVMVYIRFVLYQGYDILFYCEAHCTVVVGPAPDIFTAMIPTSK